MQITIWDGTRKIFASINNLFCYGSFFVALLDGRSRDLHPQLVLYKYSCLQQETNTWPYNHTRDRYKLKLSNLRDSALTHSTPTPSFRDYQRSQQGFCETPVSNKVKLRVESDVETDGSRAKALTHSLIDNPQLLLSSQRFCGLKWSVCHLCPIGPSTNLALGRPCSFGYPPGEEWLVGRE